MHPGLHKLIAIAERRKRIIIGLMSGTSLDGLDVALCEISGSGAQTDAVVKRFTTVNYDAKFRSELEAICFKEKIDQKDCIKLNGRIARLHAEIVAGCLSAWKISVADVDLIASHGQTVYHIGSSKNAPAATLQIGDGDHLAVSTGIITISDLRQKFIAKGGEGAPLAAYGDLLLFGNDSKRTVLINIGGIANITVIEKGTVIANFDSGPGNKFIDKLAVRYFDQPFDERGTIAATGEKNVVLLSVLADHEYFRRSPPKSTGPEMFNDFVDELLRKISDWPENLMATLTEWTAITIADALHEYADSRSVCYVSGGGAHNSFLISRIEVLSGMRMKSTGDRGIVPDAKEALLFALLANESIAGEPGFFANAGLLGCRPGKISFPD